MCDPQTGDIAKNVERQRQLLAILDEKQAAFRATFGFSEWRQACEVPVYSQIWKKALQMQLVQLQCSTQGWCFDAANTARHQHQHSLKCPLIARTSSCPLHCTTHSCHHTICVVDL